ncbi:recombinase family protein [Ensifer adhaerens]|uniref:recombinase family protein n=1 Tax=Ensifer adhaerens TaxID=106592 RepID=UPI002AA2A019|nr:recombinase family protein [Ensifer adhaerens]
MRGVCMIGTDSAEISAECPVPAAQYLRMSTEHQKYSTENQADAIREYAARNNIDIVRTYADEGISGLTFEGRPGIQRLIADVESGTAISGSFWSMTSAVGGGSRMPTKAHITPIAARKPECGSSSAANDSRMTATSDRESSSSSHKARLQITAACCRPRSTWARRP